MKIGVRAHDYGRREIEEMAALLHEEGYQAAQLVLPKAFVGINSYQDITGEHLERIRKAFEKYRISIPVFGCYMDMGNPDAAVREYALKTFRACLYYAKEIGAEVVGTETAYPHLNASEKKLWHPYMLDSIQRAAEEAAKLDMKMAIEPVCWHPLNDLETTFEVIDMVGDEEHLRVIFDASNLLEFPESTDQDEYWTEWLQGIGRYVDVLHIKDFILDSNGEYRAVPLGKGIIRYDAVSRWLHRQTRPISIIREEMNPLFAKEDIDFIKELSLGL